jgi:hypothetical protein
MTDAQEYAYLECMKAYDGTPEEFGELLHDATLQLWDIRPDAIRKRNARRKLLNLPYGVEVLDAEEAIMADKHTPHFGA